MKTFILINLSGKEQRDSVPAAFGGFCLFWQIHEEPSYALRPTDALSMGVTAASAIACRHVLQVFFSSCLLLSHPLLLSIIVVARAFTGECRGQLLQDLFRYLLLYQADVEVVTIAIVEQHREALR